MKNAGRIYWEVCSSCFCICKQKRPAYLLVVHVYIDLNIYVVLELKTFKSLYTCKKSKRPALEPTLHVYIIRRREIMVRISRRSIGPVRIQDIICLEEVYPFDTYILLNKYVLNISYTWEIMWKKKQKEKPCIQQSSYFNSIENIWCGHSHDFKLRECGA